MLCFVLYLCCVGVFGIFVVMYGRRLFSCVCNYGEEDMGLYEVPLSMSLLGFGMGTMFANFHTCAIILVLIAVFRHASEECESRGHGSGLLTVV